MLLSGDESCGRVLANSKVDVSKEEFSVFISSLSLSFCSSGLLL